MPPDPVGAMTLHWVYIKVDMCLKVDLNGTL